MKHVCQLITTVFLLSLLSCKKEKELIEVTLPEPEKVEKTVLGKPDDVKAEVADGAFQMKGLPYAYNDLEPFIDAKTMEVHYSKHLLGYCNKLNTAVKGTDWESKTIEEILKRADVTLPELRNNAGGYYNHMLFFDILSANGGEASDEILTAITTDFGSLEAFKEQFTTSALQVFGSGWVWLVKDASGKLVITTTTNQDNPLMPKVAVKGTPILALDVWEHAYYLKHQNRRKDYVDAFFNLINWKKVNEKYKVVATSLN
jgi:Fe-Mn family superoxide dismutase